MDGWVIVGTKLDSKQLDKDLKSAERRLQQYEKEAERLTKTKAKAEIDLRSYEEEKRLIKEINAESLQYAQNEQEIANNMQIEKSQLEELNQKYSKQLATLEEVNNKIKENAKNQSLMKTEIQQTSEKLEKSKMKENIEDIGKSTSKTITKVGKWALAIFGVRSAYMFVRQSASTLAQYNEKIASDLEYISFSLASMLQPVIEGIIQIVYKLLTYINMIANSLFGVNLFANATHEAFNKNNKEAKELKKTLAGFDEMNVLSDSSSGNAQNVYSPSTDLSKMNSEGEKLKKFWDDIFNFWDEDWKNWFTDVEGNWGTFVEGLGLTLKGFFDVFKGIFNSLAGIVKIFIGVFTGDMDLIEEGWNQLWEGLKQILIGVLEIIVGLIVIALGTIKGIFLDIVGWLYDNIIKPIGKFFGNAWTNITKGARDAWKGIQNVFGNVGKFFGNVFSEAWRKVKNVFSTGGKIFDGIKDGIVDAFKTIVNTLISGINTVISIPFNAINSTLNKIRSTDILGVKPFKGLWGKNPISVPKIPKLAVGGIVNMPGRGIYHGGAEIGERGAEGVIPLTNSQMMAQLGEAIGKYININATVPVYVGNRQIAREIKKINADNDFAFNE